MYKTSKTATLSSSHVETSETYVKKKIEIARLKIEKFMVLLPNFVLIPLIGFGWGVTHALYSGGKPKDTQMMEGAMGWGLTHALYSSGKPKDTQMTEGAMGWAVIVGYGLVGMAAGTLISWIL
jgi:hypothetical protein